MMKVLAAFILAVVSLGIVQPTPASAVTSPVIVIFMENKERGTIENSADADYLNSFENNGIAFTDYFGVTHPSLPNYLAFASGSTQGKVGSDSITAGEISGNVLWKQLQINNVSWGVYMESMPSACYTGTSSGNYVLRHNPAMPFSAISDFPARCDNVVPYSQFSTSNLPDVSFIAPNLCNDMHDCSIATGDNWLQNRVPAMLSAGATVVITFDEGTTSTNGGGHIYTAVDGPGITHRSETGTYDHYNLLAALEDREGLARLNNAQGVAALPLS